MHRSERFALVLTPIEKAAVKRLAEIEGGLSQAALVRRLIHREAQRLGLWPLAEGATHSDEVEQRHAQA